MNTLQADQREAVDIPHHAAVGTTGQHRAEFRRLYRRYQQLSLSPRAADQREQSALQDPLMALFRTLHPEMIYVHFEDDFDAIMRAERRT